MLRRTKKLLKKIAEMLYKNCDKFGLTKQDKEVKELKELIDKMGELVKMGFPRSFLDEAYRERGQDFAQKGPKSNSPIFFDTERFEKWRIRKLANENQAMQRGGF